MPAVRGRVGEAVDQAEHRAGDQQGARDIEPGLHPGRLPLQQQRSPGERHPGEDQVHIQRPPPGQVLGQRAAEQQADRAAGPGDRPVDGERLAAVLRPGERGGQQRQRRRHQQRRERALAGPRGHQHGEVDRRAADGRHPGEAGQAGQERDLPAQQVGQPAAGQQQAAERQGVGGDHPLPVHRGETQRPLRGRQRDVHHRQVQDHHQLRQADHAQDEPAPVPGTGDGRGIRHEIHDLFLCARPDPEGLDGLELASAEVSGHQGEQLSPDSGDLRCDVSWRISTRSRPSASISASTP